MVELVGRRLEWQFRAVKDQVGPQDLGQLGSHCYCSRGNVFSGPALVRTDKRFGGRKRRGLLQLFSAVAELGRKLYGLAEHSRCWLYLFVVPGFFRAPHERRDLIGRAEQGSLEHPARGLNRCR